VFFYAKFLPSAVALYWLFATIIGIVQTKLIYSKIEKNLKRKDKIYSTIIIYLIALISSSLGAIK
jgi:membrane protein insertase Oxa1/YidC/SpoIIIJ